MTGSPRWQRGTTLIEAMIAMMLVAIGATGVVGLQMHELYMNGEARRITEASALAQDMVKNMSSWAWNDARLSNANTSNDSDIGDLALTFQGDSPTYDHAEADLTLGGSTWTGLPAHTGFQRYWNVAATPFGRGVQVAVIVRWQTSSRPMAQWHRVVALTTRADLSGAP